MGKPAKTRAERMFFVIPRDGMRVRMFHAPTQHLPRSGGWVPRTLEWQRAINNGDVKITKPPKPPKAKTKKG